MNVEEGADEIIMKEGSVITMVDENGKQLDFIVSHISADDGDEDEEESGTWSSMTIRFKHTSIFVM